MKKISFLILVIGLVFISQLDAEVNYDQLIEKIDSLEVKLNKIETEQIKNDPFANGETSDWGDGFFLGSKAGTSNTWNLELGYMFKIKGNAWGLLSNNYISKKNNYRIGFGAGVHWFDKELVYDNSTLYEAAGYGYYGKIIAGSPILLNFMSFSGHFKLMYLYPEDSSSLDFGDPRLACGFGSDLEFWLTKNSCVTIGYTEDSDTMFEKKDDYRIYPTKVRFVFGIKSHF